MTRTLVLLAIIALVAATVCAAATRPVWPPGREHTYQVEARCLDPLCATVWYQQRGSDTVWLDRKTRLPERTIRPVCPVCKKWGEVLGITRLYGDEIDP